MSLQIINNQRTKLFFMEQYRKSPRAKFLNYDGGDYFITICTHNRINFFGEIKNSDIKLSKIGEFVDEQLRRSNDFCQNIIIPLYVVMPNHIHFIITINGAKVSNGHEQRSPNPSLRAISDFQRHIPTLSKYIASLKGAVTKYARTLGIDFGWQPRYHDHYIRGNKDGNRISEYIMNNVANWHNDCFYLEEGSL